MKEGRKLQMEVFLIFNFFLFFNFIFFWSHLAHIVFSYSLFLGEVIGDEKGRHLRRKNFSSF